MKRNGFPLCEIAIAAFCLLCASTAQAQAARTWVSGTGNDINPCSRTAPCRTFAGALSKTADGGEICALDPGDYAPLTIDKSVTINGTGTLASITAAENAAAIEVNAPATASVRLRNLSINVIGTGYGILYNSGKIVMVDHCQIHGSPTGILANLQASGHLKVLDTVIEDCAGTAIAMTTSSGQVFATIDHTRILNCAFGIQAIDNANAQVSRCIFTHSLTAILTLAAGTGSIINADQIVVSDSINALAANGSGSEIRVSNSLIAQNGTGIAGNVHSFQGNSLMGNTTQGTFVTTSAKQ